MQWSENKICGYMRTYRHMIYNSTHKLDRNSTGPCRALLRPLPIPSIYIYWKLGHVVWWMGVEREPLGGYKVEGINKKATCL